MERTLCLTEKNPCTRTHRLPLILDQVAGAAVSAETARHPSLQTPPALLGAAKSIPRSARRHSPSSVSWTFPWVSSQWDVPETPPEGGHGVTVLNWSANWPDRIENL
ncbi:hypothetical protein GOODEAATRI_027699 [Goodea atripinnis]|uniref:Uncharacterized protein n=1 Tax=Goodea atripinnis TaxID=208336 RepID=A0ABV0PHP8_9TELE